MSTTSTPYHLLAQASLTSLEVVAAVLFVIVMIIIVPWGTWSTIAIVSRKYAAKTEFDNKVWFSADDASLHRGSLQVLIPLNTVEYFVCKLVFDDPKKYQNDIDVLDTAEIDTAAPRTVEQAVRRVNEKARKSLGIGDNLLQRSKEKTMLSKKYLA